MALDDKANYTVINHLVAAQEGAGRLTGNDELKREGRQDQAQAKLQQAAERVKYAAADMTWDTGRQLRPRWSTGVDHGVGRIARPAARA